MGVAESILLGLLQGVTEFLPISSSGHLVLAQALMGVKKSGITFEVAVHLATALAVAVYYRKRLWGMLLSLKLIFSPGALKKTAGPDRGTSVDHEHLLLLCYIALGTVPAAVAGLLFKDFFEQLFQSPRSVCVMLLVTGAVLAATRLAGKIKARRWAGMVKARRLARLGNARLLAGLGNTRLLAGLVKNRRLAGPGNARRLAGIGKTRSLAAIVKARPLAGSGKACRLAWRAALLIGVAQAAAILPGISRSGVTIAAGLLLGLSAEKAAEFSFLLALPAILGAGLLEFFGLMSAGTQADINLTVLSLGSAIAMISGYMAIVFLLKVLLAGRFDRFAYYCWAAGLAGLVLL
jgi:undecaprenyl-diphosphatase